MITFTPDEVRARFGPLFSERYLVMVDRAAGVAEILTPTEAEMAAAELNVRFIDPNRGRGRIGALGALLWADEGPEAAGLYGEHL